MSEGKCREVDPVAVASELGVAGAWATLVLLTALGLVLRVVAVDRHSFWYDEAVTAALAEASYADLLTGRAKDLGNPPLYWLLARAWTRVFGCSELGFRSFSIFVGVISIPALA